MENPTADPQRIWWCPTGSLAFLPIHAAGLYGDKFNKLPRTVLPTLPSLLTPQL